MLNAPQHAPHARRDSRVQIALEALRQRRRQAIVDLMNKPPKIESFGARFDILSNNCLLFFSDTTSLHGPKWYRLWPNYLTRFILAFFIISFLVVFPWYFYTDLYAIYTSKSVSTSIELQRASQLTYPNLTVCFAKYFDKKLLDAEGISNDLANYMTMAIDPNVGHIVKFMEKEIPDYSDKLSLLQEQLQDKLNQSGLTLPELFHKVAIRCDDFIVLCEVHREFYYSDEDTKAEEKCCGAIFRTTPFFSHTGTCFTTQAEIVETLPYSFSSIKVWLNIRSDNSPKFDMIFKGSDALERRGAYYTISGIDHPITKLMQSPKKIPRGVNALVGIRSYQIDRSGLRSGFCRSNVEVFKEQYGVEYSMLNCNFFSNSGFEHDCSLSPYYGVFGEKVDRPCVPTDFLNVTPYFDTDSFNTIVGGENTVCLPSCLHTEYVVKVSKNKIDTDAVVRFSNLSKALEASDPQDLIVLQLHYNSFDVEYHSISQPLFSDELSKLGGWMGVVCGGSLCSISEMAVYVVCFIWKLYRGRVDWP